MTPTLQTRQLRKYVLALIVALGAWGTWGISAADSPNEYELKAVMLFNLTRFVEWPAQAFTNANAPIVIGVVGNNPFGDLLERAVRGETVNRRHLVVEHYERPEDLKACHLLFICSNEKSKLPLILSKLKDQPILSVSEIEGFSTIPGGMVRFYTNDQKRIRLRLNLESVHKVGLEVSSKLIQVAELDKVSNHWPVELQGLEDRLLASYESPGRP